MLDPRLDPKIGHIYRTNDMLAGFLWLEIGDSRRTASHVRKDIMETLERGEFPDDDFVYNAYALEFLSAEHIMIEPSLGDREGQTFEVKRLLDALDLIAGEGDTP